MSEPETKKPKVDGEAAAAPSKKAIITGITGQDGSYLAEFLLEKVQYAAMLFHEWRRTRPVYPRRGTFPRLIFCLLTRFVLRCTCNEAQPLISWETVPMSNAGECG